MTTSTLQRTSIIRNQRGLHARAAVKFVKVASAFKSEVTVTKSCQSVSGRSIMGLMMLAAGLGSEIKLHADGVDAEVALDAICSLIDNKFDEE